jgi:hypothetical protein
VRHVVCVKEMFHLLQNAWLEQQYQLDAYKVTDSAHIERLLSCSNSVAFCPQANYTDRATAACWRNWCRLLRLQGVAWSAQRIPTAVNPGFLDRGPLFFHSSSSSIIFTRLSRPRSRPTTYQKIW